MMGNMVLRLEAFSWGVVLVHSKESRMLSKSCGFSRFVGLQVRI